MVVAAELEFAHVGDVVEDAPEALDGRDGVDALQVCLILGRGRIFVGPGVRESLGHKIVGKRRAQLLTNA